MKIPENIYGLCSMVGLGIGIPGVYRLVNIIDANKDKSILLEDLQSIVHLLGWSIFLLIAFILISVSYFSKLIAKLTCDLRELPIKNNILFEEVNRQLLVHKATTDCIHTVLHYYRNIFDSLDKFMEIAERGESAVDSKDVEKIANEFERFVSSFLANISNSCSIITEDQCSSCIKIINNGFVKTHYRDPISYRFRQISDYQNNKPFLYKLSDNYAFKLITDPNYKETSFICDDLKKNKSYENRNSRWGQLYNATAVVPIEIGESVDCVKRHKTKKNVIGFLCVDNIKGGFEHRDIKDFISGFGDLLFNLYAKFDNFAKIVTDKGIKNDKIQYFKLWDES